MKIMKLLFGTVGLLLSLLAGALILSSTELRYDPPGQTAPASERETTPEPKAAIEVLV